MNEDKKLLTEKLKWSRLIVIVVLLIAILLSVYARFHSAGKTEITSSFVNGKLEDVSELTTSELVYTGLLRYSEGNIPFLTQNSFSMIYTATVRAGIDISKAEINVTKNRVNITLPEASVQSIDIDTDSIEFYDEHWALFNWTEKSDIVDTISAAKENVLTKADIDSLLEHSQFQTETIIKSLLSDVIGDRELAIK